MPIYVLITTIVIAVAILIIGVAAARSEKGDKQMASINVITNAGAKLLAASTVGSEVRFLSANASETIFTSEEDLRQISITEADTTGEILSVVRRDNLVRITAQFKNTLGAPVTAHTFAILASNGEGAVVFCAQSDATSAITIPGQTEPESFVNVVFNIAMNAGETVETTYTPADQITSQDLERYVSKHALGDEGEGDEEVVLGTKMFGSDLRGEIYIGSQTDGVKVNYFGEDGFNRHVAEISLMHNGINTTRINMNSEDIAIYSPHNIAIEVGSGDNETNLTKNGDPIATTVGIERTIQHYVPFKARIFLGRIDSSSEPINNLVIRRGETIEAGATFEDKLTVDRYITQACVPNSPITPNTNRAILLEEIVINNEASDYFQTDYVWMINF